MVLSANNICIGYQKPNGKTQLVLDQLDFQLQAGECVVILGESGVGKSSLLRIFAGLDKPLSGSITLFDQQQTPPHTDVGFLFQQPILLPWLNVWKNVAFGLNFKRQKNHSKSASYDRAMQALKDVGLETTADYSVSELSGGMAQRVALARLLAHQPKIMLLDEPFSALDAVNRQEMHHIICTLKDKYQTAMVMVSHDIDEAMAVADRIILLGNNPANIIGNWQLTGNTPRHQQLLALSDMRVSILTSLHEAKSSPTKDTVNGVI